MDNPQNNEPTQLQKDRMRMETRYLTTVIAMFHSLYILHLLSNNIGPNDNRDFGSTLIFILLVIINIHLYDESKCYHYCFWHRWPILFSLYYETTRILWDLDIIQWSIAKWNLVDSTALAIFFIVWFVGYVLPKWIVGFKG